MNRYTILATTAALILLVNTAAAQQIRNPKDLSTLLQLKPHVSEGLKPSREVAPRPQLPWAVPLTVGGDNGGLCERVIKTGTVINQGAWSAYANRTVSVGPRKEDVRLRQVADVAFADHMKLRNAALRVSNALLNRAKINDHVFETKDSFLLVKRTHIVVTDPGALRRSSPEWRLFLSSTGPPSSRDFASGQSKDMQLSREQQREMDTFIKTIAPRLAAGHPLKTAAAQGPQALVKAICRGEGDVVLQDTLSVPKQIRQADHRFAPGRLSVTPKGRRTRPKTNVPQSHVPSTKPVLANNWQGLGGATQLAARRLPQYARLRIESGNAAGRYVQMLGDDMPRHNISFVIQAGANRPLQDASDTFRLVPVEGTLADFRFASVFHGQAVSVGRGNNLQAVQQGLSGATVLRVLKQGRHSVLVEPNSERFIQVGSTGFLALSTRDRSQATRFSVSESDWRPKLDVVVPTERPFERLADAIVELKVASDDGTTRRRYVRTDRRGTFAQPFVAPLGSIIQVTPQHDQYVFSPPHQIVDATRNNALHFQAIEKTRAGAAMNFQANFLAGHTVEHGWGWERQWNYPSGFFRVGLGARLGVGLRFPLEVNGTMTPGSFRVAGSHGNSQRVSVNLRGRAFDAPTSFYQGVGLERSKLFDGKEVVFEAEAHYELKFRALWKTWVNIPRKAYGFNYSTDFAPPWQSSAPYRVVIPARLTRSVIDFKALKGEAISAVEFSGRDPQISLNASRLAGNSQQSRGQVDLFPNRQSSFHFDVNPHEIFRQRNKQFGARLAAGNDLYGFELRAVPQIKLRVTGEVDLWIDDFKRTFSTDWISLNQLEFGLGTLQFDSHSGTQSVFVANGSVTARNGSLIAD